LIKKLNSKQIIEALFLKADIIINGTRPFDIQVKDDRFFRSVLLHGQLGIGESYMDGWWECDAIDEMVAKFIRAGLVTDISKKISHLIHFLWVKASPIGRKSAAFEVGTHHYDLGNELFLNMLDSRMIYSCGYWERAQDLEAAQKDKLDLICRKINLQPGMTVLEIGCGWGGWAKYAAENYGVSVTGLTVSKEQFQYATQQCVGLPVEIKLQDYREATGIYDRVVSIAMFEAVGNQYFRTFMKVVDRCLKDDGLFLLHSIIGRIPLGPAESPWLNKYIFPNGELPSLAQLSQSVEGLFVEEAHHHFGEDYEKTLEVWYQNFIQNWHKIQPLYDERFFRMWVFYLRLSKGIFKSRLIQLWQFVYSKDGIPLKNSQSVVPIFHAFDAR
jgi:cyclopropane-fatty-acyl-phospholipid synthase